MFSVNYRDPLPIYEQIKLKLQQMMLSGTFSADTKLPSVRELATQLAINPNTIQRAYRELEAEGLITSIPGKGSYPVDQEILREKTLAQLYEELDGTVSKLLGLGITKDTLTAHILSTDKGGDQI